jgi:hypothetical protein
MHKDKIESQKQKCASVVNGIHDTHRVFLVWGNHCPIVKGNQELAGQEQLECGIMPLPSQKIAVLLFGAGFVFARERIETNRKDKDSKVETLNCEIVVSFHIPFKGYDF